MTDLRGAEVLLDFIGRAETARTGIDAYNTIIGHRESKLNKPLVEFTLGELLEAQKAWGKNWRSSAAGKFQIIRKTLLDLCERLDLKAEQKFSKDLQDMLGLQLLKQRGYDGFIAGSTPLRTFALALAKEWASMPVLADTQGANGPVKRGASYYAGDGLNGATVSAVDLEAILSEVLNDASKAKPSPTIVPAAPPKATPAPVEEHEEPIAPPPTKKGGINWWVVGAILVAVLLAAVAFLPIGVAP